MKKHLLLIAITLQCFAGTAQTLEPGVERWSIKTSVEDQAGLRLFL